MSTKLTLTMDKKIIEKAKKYAHQQGRSLSNLIEDYLKTLVEPVNPDFEYSPIVKATWGSVKVKEQKIDYGQLLEDELLEKYLK